MRRGRKRVSSDSGARGSVKDAHGMKRRRWERKSVNQTKRAPKTSTRKVMDLSVVATYAAAKRSVNLDLAHAS